MTISISSRTIAASLAFAAASAASASAFAQSPPPGLLNQAPASAGSTEVAQEGFQAVAAPPEESKDAMTLKLTAGGFISAGNSRTAAATGAADYLLRRSDSQLTAQLAANYGRSAAVNESLRTTVSNYQARVRYDHFFAGGLAGFLSVSGRRDRFQQLDLRLNVDPGFAYYFIDEKGHRAWAELGYDLQYDDRRDEAVDAANLDPAVPDLKGTEVRHNVRVFAGYDNQLSEAVKFNAGVEYLQNVTDAENARVNVDLGITSQLGSSFSVASTFSLKYDNNPLPGVEKTDVVTALNLVYTLAR